MVLESCMILLDNSEHMRNGDYIPTRLEAQHDAANFLVGTKTQSNPENTVGVIAMSSMSKGAELLVSPTDDMGKILGALHDVSIQLQGIDLTVSIQIASLALKHRRNKNGMQRIVVFVGSPLSEDSKVMLKTGRMLKKNNVAIDVVAMGELEGNQDKLKELVDAANGSSEERSCHLVTIPSGVLPSDVLISSPIVSGSGAATGGGDLDLSTGAPTGGAFTEFGGVDPNMDPELAMALRVSMEEERARQERLAAAAAAEETKNQEETSAMEIDRTPNLTTIVGENGNVEVTDEDALLQQALAMSMADSDAPAVTETPSGIEVTQKMEEDEDEDAAIQLALQMSREPDLPSQEQQFQDPNFVNQLLGSLPGVNPDDPAIQNALKNLQDDKKDDADTPKKDEGDAN